MKNGYTGQAFKVQIITELSPRTLFKHISLIRHLVIALNKEGIPKAVQVSYLTGPTLGLHVRSS
jgi:hypothetical protein